LVLGDDVGIINIAKEENKEVYRYSESGIRISKPLKGINIMRYNDGSTKKVIVK